MTTVVNLKHQNYDVYIGRGSKWGNPYRIGIDGTRNEVIEKYRDYLLTTFSDSDIIQLQGKTLGCFCKPNRCHGDVIVEVIEELSSPLKNFYGE